MNPRALSRRAPVVRILAIGLLGIFGAGCGREASVEGGGGPAASGQTLEGQRTRRDPRLLPVVADLEAGRPAEALAALERVQLELRAEGEPADPLAPRLLRARGLFASGDTVAALRELEEARREHAGDGRLWATEAELYATLGRATTAEKAYRQGLAAGNGRAELERAHGILRLLMPGGAQLGLDSLQRARRFDPELPFVDLPLSQAHLLVGRQRLSQAPGESRAHARAGLALAPKSLDLRELEAEALEALFDYEGALSIYAELEERGLSFGDRVALLHQKAATAALFERRRPEALDHYRAARARGLDDEALGFGATALADAASEAVERGCELLAAAQPGAAAAAFERALEDAPESPEAHHFLGVARFELGEYRDAALAWESLCALGRERELELPDPVHLNLARAWHLAGETERARGVLDDYLAHWPDGEWARPTREMLARLPAPGASGVMEAALQSSSEPPSDR